MDNYLNTLNKAQKDAVENIEGPVMVIAGAGSGKTRVLTYRIAYLMHQAVSPFSILALTFTNKAAREMKERITNLVGPAAQNLWMGTFHSIFARILRVEAEKIGFVQSFTIYDTDDAKSLIKSIVKELNLDDKIYKANSILNRISSAKNSLISAAEYSANSDFAREDKFSNKPLLGQIYSMYQKRMVQSSAMDFDDLLFNTNILFVKYPDVLLKYQHKFKYILVDEYQDTNYAQYVIIKKLAALYENITAVGDDSQSIYSFRGADIQNILNFRNDYPDYRTYKLEQNYRSTKTIVAAANSIIKHNKEKLDKNVWTANEEGEKINVAQSQSDNDEGNLVANDIFEVRANAFAKNNDFCILYRTNAQSRSFEEALRRLNIPYKIYGGLSFYQRKEIKDIVSYFRLTINPNDEEALKRVINYPVRGIGDTTLNKLFVYANENGMSTWHLLENIQQHVAGLGINRGTYEKLVTFVDLIKLFHITNSNSDAFIIAEEIVKKTGIQNELTQDKTPQGVSKFENIQELLNGIKEFVEDVMPDEFGVLPQKKLAEYIQDIALLTDKDENEEDENGKPKDTVTLMTIHASKGLEFKYVYVVGLEEDLFPSKMATFSEGDLEEERRLFYVAVTRAEKRSMLTYAETRFQWGKLVSNRPSRFIEEIDDAYLNYLAPKPSANPRWYNSNSDEESIQTKEWRKTPTNNYSNKNFITKQPIANTEKKPVTFTPKNLTKVNQAILPNNNISNIDLQEGSKVSHARFGIGHVVKLEGFAPNIKATINFEQHGDKQLLLQFAKLDILS